MAKFEIPLDDNGRPLSATISALSERTIPVIENDTKIHPFRSIPFASLRFARALDEFLEILTSSDEKPIRPRDRTHRLLTQQFEILCYRVTELFEIFEKLPNVINLRPKGVSKEASQRYRSSIDNATKDWSKLCNFVKHNSNVLVPIWYDYRVSGIIVSGFGLCEPKSDAALAINSRFHQNGERRRSFNVSLQQMIYSVMRCDRLAADIIAALPEQNCKRLPQHEMYFDVANSLKAISSRPDWAVPTQPTMFNGMSLHGRSLVLHRKRAVHVMEDAEVSTTFVADGFTKTFPYA